MIYIFNCAKEICGLPARACHAFSQLCDYINCQPCQDACEVLANCCRGFTDKPLSSYVILTGLLSICELVLCLSAFNSPMLEGCTVRSHTMKVGVRSWLVIQIGFAGLNLLFAPYFQGQVWQNILVEVQTTGLRGKIGKDVVQGSFKHVFLHDFGVLFYFFALVASFLWSMSGSHWQFKAYCNPDGSVANAAWFGMCLFWVAALYSLAWYWCSCCARSVDPEAVRHDLEQRGPVGEEGEARASQALYHGQGPAGTQTNLVQSGVAPQYAPVRQGTGRR
uniref:Uncharacterized protein n=1 Tax=Alexandrium monilatum TaxID=311494 RepID=A0A7S4Q0A8_9DINO